MCVVWLAVPGLKSDCPVATQHSLASLLKVADTVLADLLLAACEAVCLSDYSMLRPRSSWCTEVITSVITPNTKPVWTSQTWTNVTLLVPQQPGHGCMQNAASGNREAAQYWTALLLMLGPAQGHLFLQYALQSQFMSAVQINKETRAMEVQGGLQVGRNVAPGQRMQVQRSRVGQMLSNLTTSRVIVGEQWSSTV